MSQPNMKNLLDQNYDWPQDYNFKFVVKAFQLKKLTAILQDDFTLKQRPSRNGNYISVTATRCMKSSDEVLEIYNQVQDIEGIISL
ncbi:MAG: DUF493 family protein [Bacteriovoracia bacterium]